jgi:hypothetical protein
MWYSFGPGMGGDAFGCAEANRVKLGGSWGVAREKRRGGTGAAGV